MPTPLDRALNSRSTFLAFGGIITAAAVWSIWGQGEIFPKEQDPTGEPEMWTREEMRRWLAARSLGAFFCYRCDRNLHPNSKDSREQLLERVKANMRVPRA